MSNLANKVLRGGREVALTALPTVPFVGAVAVGEALEPFRDMLLETPFQTEYMGVYGLAIFLVWMTDSVQARARYLSHGRLIHPAQVLASFSIGAAGYIVGLTALQVMGIAIAADFVFQLCVNSAYPELPLIDKDEKSEYDLRIFGRTYYVPKFFTGRLRYFQVPAGLFLYYMKEPSFPFDLFA